jgi:WD40 repeat protein
MATGAVYTLVASEDGSKFAAWTARPAINDTVKNNAYELYTAKGDPIGTPYADKGRNVHSATFTPDLAWAVAGDVTGGVQIFDLKKNERIGANMPLFTRDVVDIGITADKKYIVATDVSPTGKTFVTLSNDREVKLWSLTDLNPESLTELRSWAMPGTVNGITFTPDGKSVVTANADGTAYVLELPEAK